MSRGDKNTHENRTGKIMIKLYLYVNIHVHVVVKLKYVNLCTGMNGRVCCIQYNEQGGGGIEVGGCWGYYTNEFVTIKSVE